MTLVGFNKRKMEDRRRQAAEKEAAARYETEKQILEDAEHLVAVWNERQAKRMPMLFSPTIGAAIAALLVPVGTLPGLPHHGDVDLRLLDWHPGAAVTALIPRCHADPAARMRRSQNSFACRNAASRKISMRRIAATGGSASDGAGSKTSERRKCVGGHGAVRVMPP